MEQTELDSTAQRKAEAMIFVEVNPRTRKLAVQLEFATVPSRRQ